MGKLKPSEGKSLSKSAALLDARARSRVLHPFCFAEFSEFYLLGRLSVCRVAVPLYSPGGACWQEAASPCAPASGAVPAPASSRGPGISYALLSGLRILWPDERLQGRSPRYKAEPKLLSISLTSMSKYNVNADYPEYSAKEQGRWYRNKRQREAAASTA